MSNLENYVVDQHGTVKILDTYRVLTDFEAEIYGEDHAYSDDGIAKFKKWTADHHIHFYASPNEDFFMNDAICQAEESDASYLLAENLS